MTRRGAQQRPTGAPRVEWRRIAAGDDGLSIYRVDADSGGFGVGSGGIRNPLQLILERFPTDTTRHLLEAFTSSGGPVGNSSFSVACHVVSLPERILVVDSTYRTTATDVFGRILEEIVRSEGRALADRPLQVLYTHAHFDHAGGHRAVEAFGEGVEVLAHPCTEQLFELVSRRESFLRTRAGFLRDCGITHDLEALTAEIRGHYLELMDSDGVDFDRAPWGSLEEGPLRVDRFVDPGDTVETLADRRVEVLLFEGHIPGHLCVRVDGRFLITGDMWLPATTSLVTPGAIAELGGISADRCGVLRYLESSARLLDLDMDECLALPSHEVIYRNPKRMAMRDLEIFHERAPFVMGVLSEHDREPMRVLDLAWGGSRRAPIWKVEGSIFRLVIAHEEAASYVQDLVAVGDLREVEPERYLWTGGMRFVRTIEEAVVRSREHHSGLEFRSRARASEGGSRA